MAQQVVIAGAMFEDVPSISVPDANNVYHPFLDTTIASNAAAASDIAQGKLAYVNGSLVTGTNQGGGGGGAVKMGALRPDAELVQTWSYDKLWVADEEGTIPAYSTSTTTLKASSALTPTVTLNPSAYNYIIVGRCLSYPIYNNTSKARGRQEYIITAHGYELCQLPIGSFDSIDKSGSIANAYGYVVSDIPHQNVMIYWNTSTALNCSSSSSGYGAYLGTIAPTVSGNVLTVNSPTCNIRGSSNFLNSTYWGYMTDIRFQWIIELYRVPISASVKGWERLSQLYHVRDCVNDASHTLT